MQRELCARIGQLLATTPIQDYLGIHDHLGLGYALLAYLKLPGPNYLAMLRALHVAFAPNTYVEIGVRNGDSLRLARPTTWCAAIDPAASIDPVTENVALYLKTSDEFFADDECRNRVHHFGLAFIDGDHSFAQALRDFENLERCAGPASLIAIHDVIPMDARTATPRCETSFWTGDVWKLMAVLVATRPDLVALTVACPPTGLGLVGRFGAEAKPMTPAKFAEWAALPLDMDWDVLTRQLNIVPNETAAVLNALGGREAT